jgi:hypothetical protein
MQDSGDIVSGEGFAVCGGESGRVHFIGNFFQVFLYMKSLTENNGFCGYQGQKRGDVKL